MQDTALYAQILEPTSIKHSIEHRDFSMDITVKTKHGGIVTIEKMLDGKLEQ